MGRFTFTTHTASDASGTAYNTATACFPELHGKEWYRTRGFKEIALLYGSVEQSYRKTSTLINRIRHQPKATPARTLQEVSEREGQRIAAALEHKADQILSKAGFTEEGTPQRSNARYGPKQPYRLKPKVVVTAAAACGAEPDWQPEIQANPVAYEDPSRSVNVSIDDVGVKQQKEQRSPATKPPAAPEAPAAAAPEASRKYVHNTVAHIQKEETAYTLNGHGSVAVLRLVIALLCFNDLLGYNLIFFVDGQRTLHAAIVAACAWFRHMQIILDWYHLQKKCEQQLSLALAGRAIRNQVLETLLKLLWYGLVERAIQYLQTLPADQIKHAAAFQVMIGYLERHKRCIPAYAVRQALGLRNSSNLGEKQNDLIVSERQKHNGMSWSKNGSVGLATLTAAIQNDEAPTWLKKGQMAFKLAA